MNHDEEIDTEDFLLPLLISSINIHFWKLIEFVTIILLEDIFVIFLTLFEFFRETTLTGANPGNLEQAICTRAANASNEMDFSTTARGLRVRVGPRASPNRGLTAGPVEDVTASISAERMESADTILVANREWTRRTAGHQGLLLHPGLTAEET